LTLSARALGLRDRKERVMLRIWLAASVALLSCASLHAATPAEDAYFAARDAAVAKVKAAVAAKTKEQALKKLEDEERAGLLKQLSDLVGQKPQGYDRSDLAPETLAPESPGADALDALVFVKGEKDPSIVVTTEGVAGHWLAAIQADPERKTLNLPATLPEALKAANFYTLAIGGDAAFSLHAPVQTTADPEAVALLGAFSQDVGPSAPNVLVVSARRGGLLYVIQAQPAKELKVSPACQAAWKTFEQKAKKAQKAFKASKEKDQTQLEAAQKAEAEGDEAWRQCFAKELKPDDLAAFGKQADDLVKLLP
jgi:hypothetical protein